MNPLPPKRSLSDALLDGLVIRGSDLVRSLEDRPKPVRLVTHVDALDGLQGDGLRAGSVIEMIGAGTSGRFSLAMRALAAATHAGDAAAFLDAQGHFDPQQAARAGIDLERLLWLAPQTTPQSLLSAELLLQAGFFLVVIEVGPPEKMPRVPHAVWLRLARVAHEHNAIVIVSSPVPLQTLASDAILYSEGARPAWRGEPHAPLLLTDVTFRFRRHDRLGTHTEKTISATFDT